MTQVMRIPLAAELVEKLGKDRQTYLSHIPGPDCSPPNCPSSCENVVDETSRHTYLTHIRAPDCGFWQDPPGKNHASCKDIVDETET